MSELKIGKSIIKRKPLVKFLRVMLDKIYRGKIIKKKKLKKI